MLVAATIRQWVQRQIWVKDLAQIAPSTAPGARRSMAMSLDPLLCVADRWRAEMNDDRIAALERRIAELEAQRNPPSTSAPLTQPTHFAQLDRVASAAMPRSVVREMAQAVSDRELREIVRAGNIGEPTSLAIRHRLRQRQGTHSQTHGTAGHPKLR